jgi:hypothetical protein
MTKLYKKQIKDHANFIHRPGIYFPQRLLKGTLAGVPLQQRHTRIKIIPLPTNPVFFPVCVSALLHSASLQSFLDRR